MRERIWADAMQLLELRLTHPGQLLKAGDAGSGQRSLSRGCKFRKIRELFAHLYINLKRELCKVPRYIEWRVF